MRLFCRISVAKFIEKCSFGAGVRMPHSVAARRRRRESRGMPHSAPPAADRQLNSARGDRGRGRPGIQATGAGVAWRSNTVGLAELTTRTAALFRVNCSTRIAGGATSVLGRFPTSLRLQPIFRPSPKPSRALHLVHQTVSTHRGCRLHDGAMGCAPQRLDCRCLRRGAADRALEFVHVAQHRGELRNIYELMRNGGAVDGDPAPVSITRLRASLRPGGPWRYKRVPRKGRSSAG